MIASTLASCGSSQAEDAVADLFPDPASVKFQNLRDVDNFVCGEVNPRSEAGGYEGYRRFIYDEQKQLALVASHASPSAVPGDLTACSKGEAYRSVDERLACASAPELAAERARQLRFERLWQSQCE